MTDPKSEPSELRAAAQAVVERWDTPLWKDVPATAVFIGRLRAALAPPKVNRFLPFGDTPPTLTDAQWPIRGVRVEGDTVIVSVKGGNEAARRLCGELLAVRAAAAGGTQ